MAGIGKTNIMEEIFKDPLVSRHFRRRAWVKVGPEYRLDEIQVSILAQLMDPHPGDLLLSVQGNLGQTDEISTSSAVWERNFKYLMTTCVSRRFFVVLDDLWTTEARLVSRR